MIVTGLHGCTAFDDFDGTERLKSRLAMSYGARLRPAVKRCT